MACGDACLLGIRRGTLLRDAENTAEAASVDSIGGRVAVGKDVLAYFFDLLRALCMFRMRPCLALYLSRSLSVYVDPMQKC